MAQANDRQVGGTHYQGKSRTGQQHWDMAWDFRLDPFQYQVTKYVMRWKDKDGIEALRKARHFLDKYIELAEQEEKSAQCQRAEATPFPTEGGTILGGSGDLYHRGASTRGFDHQR